MNDLNCVTVVGRTTREISERDFSYLPNGTARLNIGIAVNRSQKQQDGSWGNAASFFDVVIWGKQAENLRQYLTKGRQIAVVGRLQQDRWQDKQTGGNMSRVVIVAESVQLLGGGQQDGGGQGYAQNTYQAAGGQPQQNYGGYQQGGGQQQQGYQQQYQPMNGGQGYQPPQGEFSEDIPF